MKKDSTISQIFNLIKELPDKFSIGLVKQIITQIKEEHYEDEVNLVANIVKEKIQLKAGQSNPLEWILSFKCYIDLYCSRYATSTEGRPIDDVMIDYLNNDKQFVYLLLGKSGSGKSLYVYRHYVKMANQKLAGTSNETKVKYSYKCFYVKLNQFGTVEKK